MKPRKAPNQIFVSFSLSVIALSAFTLVGCSSDPEVERNASNLGVRMCINNLMSKSAQIDFDEADTTKGAGTVPPGAAACGEGTASFGSDVKATINKGTRDVLFLYGRNYWIAAPSLSIQSETQGGIRRICIVTDGGTAERGGLKKLISLPSIKAEAARLPDGQWKEFVVDLTDGDGVSRGESCNP